MGPQPKDRLFWYLGLFCLSSSPDKREPNFWLTYRVRHKTHCLSFWGQVKMTSSSEASSRRTLRKVWHPGSLSTVGFILGKKQFWPLSTASVALTGGPHHLHQNHLESPIENTGSHIPSRTYWIRISESTAPEPTLFKKASQAILLTS